MKKIFSLLICALLMLSNIANYAYADSPAVADENIIYLEAGSYFIVDIQETSNMALVNSRSGSKTYTYYDHGTAVWAVTLNATFTYDGSSAACTSSSCSVTIYNSSWYTVSSSASKSGNTATGAASVAHKILGVTVKTVPVTITLSCDANGNLS